jgi:hypothetical protein
LRVLLDENLDWRLGRELPGHAVESVPQIGWAGITNGQLFAKAAGRFDVLISMDTGIIHQQNLSTFNLAVIILRARSNRLADTRPLMAKVLSVLPTIKPGMLTTLT